MAHIADEVRFNLAVSKYPAPTFERKAVAIAPTGDRLERKARCGLENGIVGARRGRFASVVDLYDKIGRDMPCARRAIVVSARHRVGESLDRVGFSIIDVFQNWRMLRQSWALCAQEIPRWLLNEREVPHQHTYALQRLVPLP
jgi:hypothetical protein